MHYGNSAAGCPTAGRVGDRGTFVNRAITFGMRAAVALAAFAAAAVIAGHPTQPAAAAPGCGSEPCMAIDVIPGGGIDGTANVGASFTVDIVVQNVESNQIGAFQFTLIYNNAVLAAAVPTAHAPGFDCALLPPSGDLPEDHPNADQDPATGDAFVGCFALEPGAYVTNGVVASVAFSGVAAGTSGLRLARVAVGDTNGTEVVGCDVPNNVSYGTCGDASVTTSGGGGAPPPPPPPPGGGNTCTVAYAIDGMTVMCTDGSRLRILGVYSPLGAEAGAGWATALTQWFLAGKTITLETDATPFDEFGQRYGYPHLIGTDGADYNISVLLVYVGMARSAPDGMNVRHTDWLNAAQTWARAACWNMWNRGNPWAPESGC